MVRIVFLVELFGATATASAIREVMRTGHVGAEYVEYVLRHKRGLVPQPAPLRLGNDELDGISLPEPDLSVYDELSARPMTRDPGEPPTTDRAVMKKLDPATHHRPTSSSCSFKSSNGSGSPAWRNSSPRSSSGRPRTTSPRSTSSTASATRRSRAASRAPSTAASRTRASPRSTPSTPSTSTSIPCRKKLRARYLALHDLAFLDKGINPLFIGIPGTGQDLPGPRARLPGLPGRQARRLRHRAAHAQRSRTAPRSTAPSTARCAATCAPSSSSSTTSPSSRWTPRRPSSPSRSSPSATTTAARPAITTNRPFKDWTKVFPDALNAQVIAERLTERAEHFILEKNYQRNVDRRPNRTGGPPSPEAALPSTVRRVRSRPPRTAACEKPSRRHRVGQRSPVKPVEVGPGLAGGDT